MKITPELSYKLLTDIMFLNINFLNITTSTAEKKFKKTIWEFIYFF